MTKQFSANPEGKIPISISMNKNFDLSSQLISSLVHCFFQAEKDAAMKQAESASRAAETFMKSGDAAADPADLKEIKEALAKAQKEAAAAKKDRDSMKAQSESLAKEYDRCVKNAALIF